MIVTNFDQYQPRFRVWLRSLGAADGDDVKLYEYIIWVSNKAEEFKKINELGFFITREEDHNKFTAWLESHVFEEFDGGIAKDSEVEGALNK